MIVYCSKKKELRPWIFDTVLYAFRWMLHGKRFLFCRPGVYLIGFFRDAYPFVLDPRTKALYYGKDPKGAGYMFEGSAGAYWY